MFRSFANQYLLTMWLMILPWLILYLPPKMKPRKMVAKAWNSVLEDSVPALVPPQMIWVTLYSWPLCALVSKSDNMDVVKTVSWVCCDGVWQLIWKALKNCKALYKSKVLPFPSWKQVFKVTPCLVSIFCFVLSLLQVQHLKTPGEKSKECRIEGTNVL